VLSAYRSPLAATPAELKAKETNMRELVRLAEVREARAKQEVAGLLAERAEVFDTETARGARREQLQQEQQQQQQDVQAQQQVGSAAPPPSNQDGSLAAAAAEKEAVEVQADGGVTAEAAVAGASDAAEAPAEQPADSGETEASTVPDADNGAAAAPAAAAATPEAAVEHLLHERQQAIAEARRRKAAAKEKFAKLSQVCVAADQVRGLEKQRITNT